MFLLWFCRPETVYAFLFPPCMMPFPSIAFFLIAVGPSWNTDRAQHYDMHITGCGTCCIPSIIHTVSIQTFSPAVCCLTASHACRIIWLKLKLLWLISADTPIVFHCLYEASRTLTRSFQPGTLWYPKLVHHRELSYILHFIMHYVNRFDALSSQVLTRFNKNKQLISLN